VPSLLVTNDFPPKVGGIQSYLHELWRRLPPDQVTVLTGEQPGAVTFDAAQAFRVVRHGGPVQWPTPALRRRIDALAAEVGAQVVFLDPVLPLGLVGPQLRGRPYVVVLHGAEVTVPAHLPGTRALVRRVLSHAAGVLAAGTYPAAQARRLRPDLAGLVVPPGVDVERFTPCPDPSVRAALRRRYGLHPDRPTVVGVSRLVPRKGFDVLIDAVAMLPADAQLLIAGDGRDRRRLEQRAARHGLGARTRFLGRVPDAELPDVYRAGDVFAMLCRDRWFGLEAEGFGIVFLEAAACGLPVIAGRSGGSHEAVRDGETGFVIDPDDVAGVHQHLDRLLHEPGLAPRMGAAARRHAEAFTYDRLAARLAPLAGGDLGVLRILSA
jgi:phosphatidylinositol alpha-1,6-mannosyltransferase